MKTKQRCCGGAARRVVRSLAARTGLVSGLALGLVLGLVLGSTSGSVTGTGGGLAAPAGASVASVGHARVIGTFPADGATLDVPPARISIFLKSKPATSEGDPVQVYGPTGERVDARDATVSHFEGGGSSLSVGLPPEGARSAGDYHVAFRIISRDSHLIVGRFTFRARAPAGSDGSVAAAAPPGREPGPSYTRGAEDRWPRGVFAGGLALGLVGLATRRWRRARREGAARREDLAARRRAVTAGLGLDVDEPTRRSPSSGAARPWPSALAAVDAADTSDPWSSGGGRVASGAGGGAGGGVGAWDAWAAAGATGSGAGDGDPWDAWAAAAGATGSVRADRAAWDAWAGAVAGAGPADRAARPGPHAGGRPGGGGGRPRHDPRPAPVTPARHRARSAVTPSSWRR